MIKTGDRLIKINAADGIGVSWCVPAGPTTFENSDGETETVQGVRSGDRFVLAETADGYSIPIRVIPTAAISNRGVPGKTADGKKVLVNPWNALEYEPCSWDESGDVYAYEYEPCSW